MYNLGFKKSVNKHIYVIIIFYIINSFNNLLSQNKQNTDREYLISFYNSLSTQETIDNYWASQNRSERSIIENKIFENREIFLPHISEKLKTGTTLQ